MSRFFPSIPFDKGGEPAGGGQAPVDQGIFSSPLDAAGHMPDIDQLEKDHGFRRDDGSVDPGGRQLRDDQGRYADDGDEKDAQDQDTDKQDQDADKKDQDAEAPDKDDKNPDTDEIDYFEVPSDEEGGEITRIEADKVFEGYQRAESLETEVTQLRGQLEATPPPDYDRAIEAIIDIGDQYHSQLQALEDFLQPQPPNMELLNQANPNYDDQEFYRQQQLFTQQQEQRKQVTAERERVATDLERQDSARHQAMIAREQRKLFEVWPELKEEPVRQKLRADLHQFYGVDAELFNSVYDHRFFALAKDALTHKAQTKVAKKVAKVVRGKPKVVRGKARDSQVPKQRHDARARQRLIRTGDPTDAALVIAGLDLD